MIIHLAAPRTSGSLDPPQAQRAAAVLDRFVSAAREAVGPDGVRIEVVDRWVGTHPDGASIAVIVHADQSQLALDAVTAYLTHGLQTIPDLDGWTIAETQVAQPWAKANTGVDAS